MAEGRSGGPTDTGTFPNLNIPPQAATAQFTEEEKQAKLAQLRAVQQQPGSGRARSRSPEARRKRLQACGRRAGRHAEGHRGQVTLDPYGQIGIYRAATRANRLSAWISTWKSFTRSAAFRPTSSSRSTG